MVKSFWMKDQKGNFSNDKNDSFDPSKKYIGVRIQQGVPLLDRDWNEFDDLMRYQLFNILKYYIGNCSPDDGFHITGVPPDGKGEVDFDIGRGRMLAMGIEAVNYDPKDPNPIKYSKQKNPDSSNFKWPTQGTPEELWIYLDAWIVEVNSQEDPELKNSQDVGEETCVRHKVEWSVKVRNKRKLVFEDFHFYANLYHVWWKAKATTMSEEDRRGSLSWLSAWPYKEGWGTKDFIYSNWKQGEFEELK